MCDDADTDLSLRSIRPTRRFRGASSSIRTSSRTRLPAHGFKLTHRDMGRSRATRPLVPKETLIWQDQIPLRIIHRIGEKDVAALKAKILAPACRLSQLVSVAFASA